MAAKLVIKDNTDALLKGIRALTVNEVLVGVPNSNADRQPELGETQAPNNATIAAVQELGSPLKNIPARPFLVPGVKAAGPAIIEQMRKAGVAAMNVENPSAVVGAIDQAQHATGLIAQNAVRAKITDGPFEALSEKTLAARRRRGRTGESPLIDSGQLRASISYVVRPKGSS